MIRLNFYKNVPFRNDYSDVIIFEDSNTRFEYLSQFLINTAPIQKEMFAVIGNDENGYVDVDMSLEPFNANYLVVEQINEFDQSIRYLFYFINSYTMNASNSVRLNLTLDKWNTYFERQVGVSIEEPQIKNSICVQGHGFSNGGEEEEIIAMDKSLSIFSHEDKTLKRFRIVYHVTTDSPFLNETCLISADPYFFNLAMNVINLTSQSVELYVNLNKTITINGVQIVISGQKCNVQKINAYLIPVEFFENIVLSTLTTCYFVTSTNEQIGFVCGNLDNQGYTQTLQSVYNVDVTPEKAVKTQIGTGRTMIDLPFNNKTYSCKYLMTIGNTIGLNLIANNQCLNIINDYVVNITYDEYSSYIATHEQTEQMKSISTAIGLATGIGGVVGGAVSGNIPAVLGGVGSLIGSGLSYANNQAKLNDMQTIPAKISSDTDTILTLYIYGGQTIWRWTPANQSDILDYDNYFGFKFNGFYDDLDIISHEEDDRFKYVKCSEISIIGEFNQSVKNSLENMFLKGVRVWYNPKYYLSSMTQKLTSEELNGE